MEIGAVFPHNEIGNDPGAIRAYAQGLEGLGVTHLLIYDHEPFTTFAFIAACTAKLEMITTVLILPQRQTVLVAKQAAELALLSENRFRLGVGTGCREEVATPAPAGKTLSPKPAVAPAPAIRPPAGHKGRTGAAAAAHSWLQASIARHPGHYRSTSRRSP